MNNEEKILALLEGMQVELGGMKTELGGMKAEQQKTNERLDRLETKVDRLEVGLAEVKKDTEAIFEHTALLTESQTVTERAVAELTAIIKENTFDIIRLKAVR